MKFKKLFFSFGMMITISCLAQTKKMHQQADVLQNRILKDLEIMRQLQPSNYQPPDIQLPAATTPSQPLTLEQIQEFMNSLSQATAQLQEIFTQFQQQTAQQESMHDEIKKFMTIVQYFSKLHAIGQWETYLKHHDEICKLYGTLLAMLAPCKSITDTIKSCHQLILNQTAIYVFILHRSSDLRHQQLAYQLASIYLEYQKFNEEISMPNNPKIKALVCKILDATSI